MAWFALLGQFSEPAGANERRSAGRRKLAFDWLLEASRPGSNVVVLDLSEAGMMFHARQELAVGETFEVAMSETGPVEACVVWKRTTLYGCKFLSPVSRGTISAILLRAGPGFDFGSTGGTER